MHDKNGNPVKVGDKVIVEAVIRETYATDEFCNVQLGIGYEDGKEHGAHNVQSIVTINTKQIELVEFEGDIQILFDDLKAEINKFPNSREKSIALTNLDNTRLWYRETKELAENAQKQ